MTWLLALIPSRAKMYALGAGLVGVILAVVYAMGRGAANAARAAKDLKGYKRDRKNIDDSVRGVGDARKWLRKRADKRDL